MGGREDIVLVQQAGAHSDVRDEVVAVGQVGGHGLEFQVELEGRRLAAVAHRRARPAEGLVEVPRARRFQAAIALQGLRRIGPPECAK